MLHNTGWGLTQVQRQLEMTGVSVGVVHWQCNKRVSIVQDVGQDVRMTVLYFCVENREIIITYRQFHD
jgi:hypothetical protein